MTIKENGLCYFLIHGSFTPVCTTELIAFSKADTYFKNLNTDLIGLSIDSSASHLAWLFDIYLKTGIKVPFPIIADRSGEIARKYGMISNEISSTETVRNVFIIDDRSVIRTILVYPMNIGRCIAEILRIIEALQTADFNKSSTPANWIPSQPIIVPTPKTYKELEERVKTVERDKNGISWYLNLKKAEYNKKLNESEIKKI